MLTLQTFATEEEAIELANSTEYGLSGIVLHRARRRARSASGARCAPGPPGSTPSSSATSPRPFGGMGISGIGREGGDYALDFYSELKTLQIAEGTTPRD